jgi:nitric oxide reductase subunit B
MTLDRANPTDILSPWWRRAVLLTVAALFIVLLSLSLYVYRAASPIPDRVVTPSGATLFTRQDILEGQRVFLKYGLMENGSIWGHGAYLGPDFSAEHLHRLVIQTRDWLAGQTYHQSFDKLSPLQKATLAEKVKQLLKQNQYDPELKTLVFTEPETTTFHRQISLWKTYFNKSDLNRGLKTGLVDNPQELRQFTAFVAWAAWVSVANQPHKPYSYTNNFPYDPEAGNTPTADAILWSALSLIFLFVGTALVLFAFGKFNYLGWKGKGLHIHPQLLPGQVTDSQKATLKYFVLVALLFLGQTLVGGATAHFQAAPESFYGFNLSAIFPSNLVRMWHLQLGIFWIATAYVAGGLFLASLFGNQKVRGQTFGTHILFGALVLVIFGSLLGEFAGIHNLLGRTWYWLGLQGWEYLDLGRGWQILLGLGFLIWAFLLVRAIGPSRRSGDEKELASIFLYVAFTIPLFYLPAYFYSSTTHFTVVDTWRFWIIHLWVEGFWELLATVMVAVIFFKLDMVSRQTATRVIYLDALLFLGSGILGTGHHWYWTGQTNLSLALSAAFSAMEPVPLILLTLDAWDFIKLSRSTCDICGKEIHIPHKWTFYFLIAVGFWNFVGAGIFGFLINLPIVSFFEAGTNLTPNHGHAALMGVFGMLAVALLVFVLRQVSPEWHWARIEKYIRVSFWGLNIGLMGMVVLNLFPVGVLQLQDVLTHGYWHGRSTDFLNGDLIRFLAWLRLPADLVFIVAGVMPLVIATLLTYRGIHTLPKNCTLVPESE